MSKLPQRRDMFTQDRALEERVRKIEQAWRLGELGGSGGGGGDVTDADLAANSTADRARANHTGFQIAATISDFHTAVRTNRLDQMAAPTAPVSMGGYRVTNLGTPTGDNDAATKAYVDSLIGEDASSRQVQRAHIQATGGYTNLASGSRPASGKYVSFDVIPGTYVIHASMSAYYTSVTSGHWNVHAELPDGTFSTPLSDAAFYLNVANVHTTAPPASSEIEITTAGTLRLWPGIGALITTGENRFDVVLIPKDVPDEEDYATQAELDTLQAQVDALTALVAELEAGGGGGDEPPPVEAAGHPWVIDGNLIRDTDGSRIVLRGASAWMLPMFGPWADFVANADNQYDNRDAIFTEMASLGINIVRIGMCPDTIDDDGARSTIYDRAKDLVYSAKSHGIATLFTFWTADASHVVGTGLDDFLAVQGELQAVIGDDPWVMYNPMNEPHGITASQWQAMSEACIDYYRTTLNYTNLLVIDPNSYAGVFADQITQIAAVQAADDNLLFSFHQYANGQPAFSGEDQTYNGSDWFETQYGPYLDTYAIATTESGSQNGDPSSINLTWNEEFMDYTAEHMVPRGWNGHMEFLWAWVDNAITDADSGDGTDTLTDLTTLNTHGELARDHIWSVLVDGVDPVSTPDFDPPVVDNFNRADGLVGANWLYNDNNLDGIYNGLVVSSNRAGPEDTTNGWGSAAWHEAADNLDAAFTITTLPTAGQIVFDLLNAAGDGFNITCYDGGDGTGRADLYVDGAYITTVVTGTWAANARMGIRHLDTATEVWWSPTATGDWTRSLTSDQPSAPAGPYYAKPRFDYGTSTTVRVDDFAFVDLDA